jgi:hypothetical protein
VFTVRHSTRTIGKFVDPLRNLQFNKEVLWDRIRERGGTSYALLRGLGGHRAFLCLPNADWRNPSFRGYADHMFRPELAIMVYTPLSRER